MAKLLEALMDMRRWDTETLIVKTGPKAFAFLSDGQRCKLFWCKARIHNVVTKVKRQMLWSEVDLFVSFGISSNLQTIEWFRQRIFKSVFGKETHLLRLRLILRCWGRSQDWNANVHLNFSSFWEGDTNIFYQKLTFPLQAGRIAKATQATKTRKCQWGENLR